MFPKGDGGSLIGFPEGGAPENSFRPSPFRMINGTALSVQLFALLTQNCLHAMVKVINEN